MAIPDRLVPLVTSFRPQLEDESDRQYLSAAFTSAQATSLRALEHRVDRLLVALGDVDPLEDVR